MLVACHHPREPLQPIVPAADGFSRAGQVPMTARWWEAFADDQLNQYIETALTKNFSLTAARQRLQAAKSLVRREASQWLPTLDADVGVGYVDADDNSGEPLFGVGMAASYEVDLWGRIDALVTASRQQQFAVQEAYQTAALTVAAEVASNWFRLLEARAEFALLKEQIQTNEKILRVLEARFSSGQTGSADVLRQRQLVEATREQLHTVEQRGGLFEHVLHVLQGAFPRQAMNGREAFLPALPPLPATGLPSDLLARRPDVRQAYFDLYAQDAQLAAAIANRYPRLDLTASASTAVDKPEQLFEQWAGSVVGQLLAPLVDGGRRRAEVSRQRALVQAQAANYVQIALNAFREVEDALLRERQQLKIVDSIEQQLELNELAYVQLRAQYMNGAIDYLSVLTNLTEGQRLQRALLAAKLNLLEIRIALYRALAGGFE